MLAGINSPIYKFLRYNYLEQRDVPMHITGQMGNSRLTETLLYRYLKDF